MTLSTSTSKALYNGNAATTEFSAPFRFFTNADLLVELVSSGGVSATQVLDTDYTVTGAGDDAGGAVTMAVAPATGEVLVIRRVIAATQEVDYISGEAFPAETHEAALDRLTMIAQQNAEAAGRALTLPSSDTAGAELPSAPLRASKYLAFDAGGAPVVVSGTDSSLIVTPFAETLLDDTDAATARATLGATTTGSSLITAASQAAAQAALGATATGSAVLTAADAAAARLAIGLPGTGQLAGLRNLVVNGNFNLNPRGYVSGTATSISNQYTLGMWRVVTSGQSLTFTASGNGNQVTAPAGGIEQVIEGSSIGGGSYVVSWTGTGTCSVNGTARAKGETFTLTANTSATVKLVGQISKFQLEPGEVFTGFDERPIGLETLLLQCYIRKLVNVAHTGYQLGSSGFRQFVPISPPMRTTPTATLSNVSLLNITSHAASLLSDVGFCLEGVAVSTGAVSIQADILLSTEP